MKQLDVGTKYPCHVEAVQLCQDRFFCMRTKGMLKVGPRLTLGQAQRSSCMLWPHITCTRQQSRQLHGVALHTLHWLATGGSCIAGHKVI